ncbi:MAG TPA: ATP-binding protein [Stellaceae bacterium]|nr:ATP-binding protein [Stellaceae bacterium]
MIRLLRSVSVRLALGYGAIFILSSFLLVGALWWRTAAYLDREVDAVILADAQAVGDRLHDFGLIGALETVRDRVAAESDEHAIYLLADPGLHALAGNLNAWPAQIAGGPGWYEIGLARNGKLHATRMIYAALPGGYRLLVGRDVQDRVAIRGTILGGLGWAVVIAILLAIGGGLLIRRAVLRQVEAINRATAAIVRGDLARRLPTRDSTDEFDQLSQTINGMLGQIQILIEGVRNASNTVAHDLRTPLAELRNRLEELLRRRPPPEEAWTEVQGAVGDLDRVIGVFNALLRLADIDSGARLSGFRAVRLDTVAGEVAELYGPVAEAKGSDLAFDPPSDAVTVQGDPDLLAQAISNLVDNAVKFTPAGGRVALAVTRDADGGANVRVTDSGPGIADSEKAEVVRRFYRGDAGKGKSGVGLGLSVVAAVAKLHGGRLEFADGNPGLVATLILPATTAPGALPGPAS